MHSSDHRDATISRVNEAFAKHRTHEDWPIKAKWDLSAPVAAPYGQKEYVAALYTICAEGVVTGRLKDEPVIVGDRVK